MEPGIEFYSRMEMARMLCGREGELEDFPR